MKTIIQILLFFVAVLLTYLIYQSVQRPLIFEKAREDRYKVTIQRLKDIRTAQEAFKGAYGRYTGSWDTLVDFIMHDSVKNVRKIGELTDSMIEAKISERKAIEMGLIIRDTIKESVLESLFPPGFDAKQLKYVPVKDTLAEFFLGASTVTTGSGIVVPVFEARAHNNVILKNLDRQLVINLNDQRRTNEKYPGLKVGSLTEAANNAGNWE